MLSGNEDSISVDIYEYPLKVDVQGRNLLPRKIHSLRRI